MSETLKAISDPVRREILELLKDGRKTAGEIWSAPLRVDTNKKAVQIKWYNTLPKGGVFFYGFKGTKICFVFIRI